MTQLSVKRKDRQDKFNHLKYILKQSILKNDFNI